MIKIIKTTGAVATVLLCISTSAFGLDDICDGLPNQEELQIALQAARESELGALIETGNSGSILDLWATIVNRDGFVCAVAFSGASRYSQRLGGRIISAQKAYTANAFSLDGLALSTANLYAATQPGGSLFGLEESNPVATAFAYGGDSRLYGTASDPMVHKKVGGISANGGGLGLYSFGKIIGAIGVSGDSSCADHNIAWRIRDQLGLDSLITGVNKSLDDSGLEKGDNIIFDINNGVSASGFGHPACDPADPNKPSSQETNETVILDAPLN